jgi:uncharacterized protein YbjT (DUF2867 family)
MKTILVTGATGYIGGRLIPILVDAGYHVRCMVRDERRIRDQSWYKYVDMVKADVFDANSLNKAMHGIDSAYYLIHSMAGGKDFHQQDLVAAKNFGQSAKKYGVKQLIYLGGLGNAASDLSIHLRSRQDTGKMLRKSGVPLTEFRAAVIVGSGSLSFEMIRYLTERVPVMICPSWIYNKTQPIAVSDVISYLIASLENKECLDQIIEIGGDDVVTYKEMMTIYARMRGLKRWMIPIPVLTPRLSSYWVHLVTPIPSTIAQPLIDGLKNEVIVQKNDAQHILPQIKPISYEEAVNEALSRLPTFQIDTPWSDNIHREIGQFEPVILTTDEGVIRERRQISVQASAATLYQTVTSLGGNNGWFYMTWVWRIRGLFDSLIGGVGMRRGRRDPKLLRVGDPVDFWRVEAVIPDELIRLHAEMRVPGETWLQFEIHKREDRLSTLIQTNIFVPKGLTGLLYWYLTYPIHRMVFNGLIRKISEHFQ